MSVLVLAGSVTAGGELSAEGTAVSFGAVAVLTVTVLTVAVLTAAVPSVVVVAADLAATSGFELVQAATPTRTDATRRVCRRRIYPP